MDSLSNDNGGVNVYDLNPGKFKNELLMNTASVFTQAGFRIANKERYMSAVNDMGAEFNVSNDNPDVALVCQGDVSDAVLENAMVFLEAGSSGPAHVYLALPEDTAQEKLDQIGNMDCLLHQTDEGSYVGYITLDRDYSGPGEMNLAPFEDALDKIRSLNIETEKYPFTPEALGLLPLFANASEETIRNNIEDCAEVIGQHFKDNINAFDMPDNLKEIALNHHSAPENNANEPEPYSNNAPGRSRRI